MDYPRTKVESKSNHGQICAKNKNIVKQSEKATNVYPVKFQHTSQRNISRVRIKNDFPEKNLNRSLGLSF